MLVIWGAILYLFRSRLSPNELPFLLIFIALPFPLIRPLYKRYLQGTSPIKVPLHFCGSVGNSWLDLHSRNSPRPQRRMGSGCETRVGNGLAGHRR
jgi:hypothetical protein